MRWRNHAVERKFEGGSVFVRKSTRWVRISWKIEKPKESSENFLLEENYQSKKRNYNRFMPMEYF